MSRACGMLLLARSPSSVGSSALYDSTRNQTLRLNVVGLSQHLTCVNVIGGLRPSIILARPELIHEAPSGGQEIARPVCPASSLQIADMIMTLVYRHCGPHSRREWKIGHGSLVGRLTSPSRLCRLARLARIGELIISSCLYV